MPIVEFGLSRDEAPTLNRRGPVHYDDGQQRQARIETLSISPFDAIQAIMYMAQKQHTPISLVGEDREKVVEKVERMLGRKITIVKSNIKGFEREVSRLMSEKQFFILFPMDVYWYSSGRYDRIDPMLGNRFIHLKVK